MTRLAALLMAAQAALGLAFPGLYRDTGYVAATWFGNDLVTLLLAVPVLLVGLALDARGSEPGRLLLLGGLGYGAYNYAFYMLGAALNVWLPLYVAAFLACAVALGSGLAATEARAVADGVRPRTPARFIGGYFVVVATGLAAVWLAMWGAHVFAGRPTPGPPDAFRLVAVLDLTFIVPAVATGGVLLWRRKPWGYVVAAVAGIQASLYLTVLAVNSVRFVLRGTVDAPGEIPVWGGLAAATGAVTALLLSRIRTAAGGPPRDDPRPRPTVS